jgi:hypothetical protein
MTDQWPAGALGHPPVVLQVWAVVDPVHVARAAHVARGVVFVGVLAKNPYLIPFVFSVSTAIQHSVVGALKAANTRRVAVVVVATEMCVWFILVPVRNFSSGSALVMLDTIAVAAGYEPDCA